MTEPVFDPKCCRCGTVEKLVQDPHVEGLFVCRDCLDRVDKQNEMIALGLEQEPEVNP